MKYIILFLYGSLVYSQQDILVADYDYMLKFEQAPSTTSVNSRLISNGLESNYEIDFVGDLDYVELEGSNDGGSILSVKADKNPIIYKNHKEKAIYSIERILLKPFLVKDTLDIFQWEIEAEKKEILGYDCQKATTNFRGREYTAYFTSDIPFDTGPWKFSGLPGLILQVYSNDGVFKINVNKIEIKKEYLNIENPYIDYEHDPISWKEYTNEYSKKYEEFKGYSDPNGSKISIPKKLIETVVSPKYLFSKD